jgi:prepilin-type processing-associated H-X9-DG protein
LGVNGGSNPCTPFSTGLFVYYISNGLQQITDGTSNTIAYAESLVGNAQNPQPNQRNNSVTGVTGATVGWVADASAVSWPNVMMPAIQACTQQFQAGSNISNGNGARWGWGAMSMSLFNTVVPPNSKFAPWNSCRNTCGGCGPDDSEFSNAQSNHPGGVNVMFCDGSVRFIKDSISIQTWMALGTKSNGEVITSDSY